MADTISQLRVIEKLKLNPKLKYGGFRKCRSRFSYHTFEIVNDGSNRTVQNSKKASVFIIEIRVQGFSKSLIRSCHQTLEIQSDGKSSREALNLLKIVSKGFRSH